MLTKFDIGRVRKTEQLWARLNQDEPFSYFCADCLARYVTCDWGDASREESLTNYLALANDDLVVGVYRYPEDGQQIVIATEPDRSATYLFLASEWLQEATMT